MNCLSVGDQAPWFQAPAVDANPNYHFDTAAGRVILLLLGGSMACAPCAAAMRIIMARRDLFDDLRMSFFGISTDPSDLTERRIFQQLPGIRWFIDFDHRISELYGSSIKEGDRRNYTPVLLVLDHRLRVAGRYALEDVEHAILETVRLADEGCGAQLAPVLEIPRVFEPEVCRYLISRYDEVGGTESGFMRQKDGLTYNVLDNSFKRRSDYNIEDPQLQTALNRRLANRVLPEIKRAFQFDATYIERWLVACYESDNGGGFFHSHRDNTTLGTAHRRFACTINLNAEEFEGGELRFPEYGARRYRAMTGGAIIFSCSLLHEALPVTRGKRYAFLPFFYDHAAAKIRDQNKSSLQPT